MVNHSTYPQPECRPFNFKFFLLLLLFFVAPVIRAQVIISGPDSACAGQTDNYTVTAVAGGSYSWAITDGTIAGNSNSNSVAITWDTAGPTTIFISITDIYNHVTTGSLNVTVHPNPNPKITWPAYPTCPVDTQSQQGTGGSTGGTSCINVCKNSTILYSTTAQAGDTYQWIITGAVSFTGQGTNSITVNWNSANSGSVSLIETNQWGCTDSTGICIIKQDVPVAFFSTHMNVCLHTVNNFTNLSTGATSYQWYFGDGGSSNAVDPTYAYASAGTYTITLVAMNDCHCADTFRTSVTVNSLPGPDIECPSTVCAGDTQTYYTDAAGCVYNWSVTGGSIISGAGTSSVTVAWGAGMIGSVSLYVTGCGNFCSDTTTVIVPIIPSVATISGPDKVCPGDCETYSLPLFSGSTYTWSITGTGGGYITTQCCGQVQVCWPLSPISGNDTLNVSYFDTFLNCGGSGNIVIHLRPQLALIAGAQVCAGSTTSVIAYPGINCNWSILPAGSTFTGNGTSNIIINWAGVPGTYTITAIPVNPNQVCNDSASVNIKVVASPPSPVITGDTIVCPNSAYSYCATGTNVSWIVTNGTPATGNGSCISVTWGNTGPYLVQAIQQLSAAPGCPSDTGSLTVQSALPVAPPNITGPVNVCANSTNTFTNTVSYPAYATLNWSISPSNLGSITGGQGTNTITVQWSNNAPASPVITLTVALCSQTQTVTQTVTLNPVPNPGITVNGIFCPGNSVTLSASGGGFASYQWSGPGFSSNTNPSAAVTVAGNYHLTVTGTNGCNASTSQQLIALPGPVASISTGDPVQYCIGNTFIVQLNALSNPGYTYAWSNGSTTDPVNVSVAGTYRVTVTGANGCTSLSNAILVSVDTCSSDTGSCTPVGTVSFLHPAFYGCNPDTFINTSVNAGSFTWFFGDGGTSNATNGLHTYASAGFYLVTLQGYVPNSAGNDSCLLDDTAHIKIPLAPRFGFVSGCANDSVCFTDLSTFTPGNNIISWNWNFGDSHTSAIQNPCHKYSTGGTYIVTLTISDGTCSSSVTDTMHVLQQPVAAFTFSSPSCIDNNIPFTDASTPASDINFWSWSFGDGGSSLNQNPDHSYGTAGPFTVQLAIRDTLGCTDTASSTINIVSPNITGNITIYPDTIVCAGTNVLLVAPACSCTYLWNNGGTHDSTTASTTGDYVVTITDANGCHGTRSVHVLVNPAPVNTINNGGAGKFCLGGNTYIYALYSPDYLYYWSSNDTVNNGSTANGFSVIPATAGVYYYILAVTDTTTGCSDTSLPYLITVTDTPTTPLITVIAPATICQGDTVTLIASDADPYAAIHWSNGDVGDTIRVTASGCYKAILVDSNGCSKSAKVCGTAHPLPETCSFWTGCLDTCSPFTIHGPAGNTTYQWLLNGNPIAGATSQNYTATVSGTYSLIMGSSYGCTDTTGFINLTLRNCADTCATLITDTVYCNGDGQYIFTYHIINHSGHTINQINLLIQPPYLSTLYGPVTSLDSVPDGGTSAAHTVTIYGLTTGAHPCFVAHVQQLDSNMLQLCCCNSDTDCVTLPSCDTTCCYLHILTDSVWCTGINPDGLNTYGFKVLVNGCGQLVLSTTNGEITSNTNYQLTPGDTLITGSFTQLPPVSGALCLGFTLEHAGAVCHDTSVCMQLPDCNTGCCYLHVLSDSIVCKGMDTSGAYIYGFKVLVNACGDLTLSTEGGTITSATSFNLTGGDTLISGMYVRNPQDTGSFCLSLFIIKGPAVCADTALCLPLPPCDSVPVLPQCYLQFPDSICQGQSATFLYTGNIAGHIFTWTFNGGTPATAAGAGPHTVTYNSPGCFAVELIITTGEQRSVCHDSICVIAPPAASISRSGNTLNAFPAGMNYQWYLGPPNWTMINGAVNQFFNPGKTNVYCVVVTNNFGCRDTACTDFESVGIDELNGQFNWSVVPNPNNGNFELVVQNPTGDRMSFTITNAIGQAILHGDFETSSTDVIKIPVSHTFAAGIYIIKLESGEISAVGKMVVK